MYLFQDIIIILDRLHILIDKNLLSRKGFFCVVAILLDFLQSHPKTIYAMFTMDNYTDIKLIRQRVRVLKHARISSLMQRKGHKLKHKNQLYVR